MIEQQLNLEQQGMLAKLLAKENLRIQHGNFTTAFFDVKARVLGLPMWQTKGKAVYDLLCGHEVGHALYTPVNGHEIFKRECPKVPFSICNIVEDIRIERIIQDTYPGLATQFRKAYAQLADDQFFGVNGKNLSKLSIGDRLNIHAKTRGIIPVPLSAKEMALYEKAYAATTFDDVIQVCKDLAALVKEEQAASKAQKPQQKPQPQAEAQEESEAPQDPTAGNDETDEEEASAPSEAPKGDDESTDEDEKSEAAGDSNEKGEESDEKTPSTSGESQEGEADEDEESEDGKPTEGEGETEKVDGPTSTGVDASDEATEMESLSTTTDKAFEQSLKQMSTPTTGAAVNNHSMAPKATTISKITIPFATLLAARTKSPRYDIYMKDPAVIEASAKIKAKSKKYVGALTNHFNMRKSAFQYARATEARTGVLNLNRLHSYKYADDIFKSISKLADAKNHGMMLFIDNSASMNGVLGDVLEHTLNLVLFCRSVGIPFQVLTFTNQPEDRTIATENAHFEMMMQSTRLVELFSSKMTKGQFDTAISQTTAQIAHLSGVRPPCTAGAFDHQRFSQCPAFATIEEMEGTPLLEAIVAAHTLVKQFRKSNSIQKMNVIFLTDGDGGNIQYNRKSELATICPATGHGYYEGTLNGKKLKLGGYYEQDYIKLITNLRQTCQATVVNFYIPSSQRNALQKIVQVRHTVPTSIGVAKNTGETDAEKNFDNVVDTNENFKKAYNKDKCMEIIGGYGFSAYYVVGDPEMIEIGDDDDFNPDFDSNVKVSTNKMAKAFGEFAKNKQTSRVFLQKFAKMIA